MKFICQSHYCEFYNMVKASGNSEKELPRWLSGKKSACNAGHADDMGSIPGSGKEEGTVTHSSVLAWRIPWTEQPSGLQPIGSKRVGHD